MLYVLTDIPAYATALAAAAMLSMWRIWRQWRRQSVIDWRITRVAAAIVVNWIVGMLYVSQTHDATPWQFNMFIDSGAALTVLWHPAGREQAFIGWLYGLQIMAHLIYGALSYSAARIYPDAYYTCLTIIAYGQLAVLGDWSIGSRVEDYLSRAWRRVAANYRRARVGTAGEA